jgi:ribonuclease D
MTHRISASWEALLTQAVDTSRTYFSCAKRTLSESELDYTAADVIALAALMAEDFKTSAMSVAAQRMSESIEYLGEVIQEASSS